ncbi:TPA: hypothetical protein ACUT48_005441 [Pseudomonas aeruginosa]
MSEAFNPDYLRQHLRPLAAAEADAAVLAYQAYYGLDLRSRHPRLQARLGSMAVDGRRLAVQAWLLPEARGSLLLMHVPERRAGGLSSRPRVDQGATAWSTARPAFSAARAAW